jgi:hypothetical protein
MVAPASGRHDGRAGCPPDSQRDTGATNSFPALLPVILTNSFDDFGENASHRRAYCRSIGKSLHCLPQNSLDVVFMRREKFRGIPGQKRG